MTQHVPIRVGRESDRRWNMYPTEHQGVTLNETVHIVPTSYPERHLHPSTVECGRRYRPPALLIPALLDRGLASLGPSKG